MAKVIQLFITLSIVFFLAILLLVYAFLPDPSGLLFNEEGIIMFSTSRNTFFFSGLIIFVLIQTLGVVFGHNILKKNNTTSWRNFSTWFLGMRLSINLFLILLLIFIGLANNAVDYSFDSIRLLAYLGPAILIGWLCTFPLFRSPRRKP